MYPFTKLFLFAIHPPQLITNILPADSEFLSSLEFRKDFVAISKQYLAGLEFDRML